ncbi:MAG: DUF952 domain-containing protein, partial [Oscillospiraceae bacterium]|nr:DUF952 domain-containing protein [Oscillospiraceae bacterium]
MEEATTFCLWEGSENMILHIMKSSTWEERKNKDFWGKRNIDAEGFIHCSRPEFFWRVAPNFDGIEDEMVIICIDENKLSANVKYEDGDNCGRSYPHVYGKLPDIDIDLAPSKRPSIFRAIRKERGELGLVQVATFGTEGTKSAV